MDESRVTVIPVINLATAQWTAEAARARTPPATLRVQANKADPNMAEVAEAVEDEVTVVAVVEETMDVPQMTHSSMMIQGINSIKMILISMERTTFNTL